ncbi:hypothetical protein ACPOL_1069 [Acidisarcina polymorpha]|uniref:Flagella basal body P-ring formation protein FlgA SAF domain-containing protein n=1 Tax=Acidisarcina polymorpha TaxID=2211140 RepID=A0A2Z5FUJ9_9BACT|nr:hypothetical protein ACPOL_1069 [Acidisarcina polymorpha]
MERCAHPEMPNVAIESLAFDHSGQGSVAPYSSAGGLNAQSVQADNNHERKTGSALPLVLAGSRVRLWRQDPIARIDLSGVALESGLYGSLVKVRLTSGGNVLQGIVRSTGSVELNSIAGPGFTREDQ